MGSAVGGDEILAAAALLDWLLHHAQVIAISGTQSVTSEEKPTGSLSSGVLIT